MVGLQDTRGSYGHAGPPLEVLKVLLWTLQLSRGGTERLKFHQLIAGKHHYSCDDRVKVTWYRKPKNWEEGLCLRALVLKGRSWVSSSIPWNLIGMQILGLTPDLLGVDAGSVVFEQTFG